MNRILSLLVALILTTATARADVAIEKDDTFPSTTSISTKHENQGPWRIVMLDRDEDIITSTFYITSLKPMAFDKTKNGVFTIDGVNLPAKLITSKKTVMTDYNLAAGQFDLSPLKEKFIGAKTVTVTCFFNTGQVVTWEVSPEIIEDWRVVFLLPDGGRPAKQKEKAPTTKPGVVKPEAPKADSAKPAAKPAQIPAENASSPPTKKTPPPTTTPAQSAPKESPAPAAPAGPAPAVPAPKPAEPAQEKPQQAAPVKQAPAEPAKPAQTTPAPAALEQQPPAPAASPVTSPIEKTESPAREKPAGASPSAQPAVEQAAPAAAPPPRPLWQPHAPQPAQEVKQPQKESVTPVSGGLQSFEDEEEPPAPAPNKTAPNPEPVKPAPTGEKK